MPTLATNGGQLIRLVPSAIAIFVGIVVYAAEMHYTTPIDIAVICISILGNLPAMWLQYQIFSGRASGFDNVVRDVDPGLTRRYIVFGSWISEAVFTVVLIVMVSTLGMPDALQTAMAVNIIVHGINIIMASHKYWTLAVDVVFGGDDYEDMSGGGFDRIGSDDSLDPAANNENMLDAIEEGDDLVFDDTK